MAGWVMARAERMVVRVRAGGLRRGGSGLPDGPEVAADGLVVLGHLAGVAEREGRAAVDDEAEPDRTPLLVEIARLADVGEPRPLDPAHDDAQQ